MHARMRSCVHTGKCMYEDEEYQDGCGGPVQAFLFTYSFIFFGCLIVFNLFVAVLCPLLKKRRDTFGIFLVSLVLKERPISLALLHHFMRLPVVSLISRSVINRAQAALFFMMTYDITVHGS